MTDAAKRIKSKFKIIDVADTRLLNYDKTKLRKYLDDNNAAIKDRKNILPANEIDKLTKGIKPQNKSEVPFDAQSWIAKDFLEPLAKASPQYQRHTYPKIRQPDRLLPSR